MKKGSALNKLRVAGFVFTFSAFLGGLLFRIICGGGALLGRVKDGHYYLTWRQDFIEVGRETFQLGKAIDITFLISFGLTFVISLVWAFFGPQTQDQI